MKTLSVKAGDRLTFLGCTWDEYWKYGAPYIIYSPIKRYAVTSCDPDDMVADLCDDLAEFKWRRWSPRGFAKRQNATHVRMVVEFYEENGELDWREIELEERRGPFPTRAGDDGEGGG